MRKLWGGYLVCALAAFILMLTGCGGSGGSNNASSTGSAASVSSSSSSSSGGSTQTPTVPAPSGGSATFDGRILDELGNGVPGATVTVKTLGTYSVALR